MIHGLHWGVIIDFFLFNHSVCISRISTLLGCMSFGVRSLMDPDKVGLNTKVTDIQTFCKWFPVKLSLCISVCLSIRP